MAGRVDIPLGELIRLAEQLEGFPVTLNGRLVGRITNPVIANGMIMGTIVLTDGRQVDTPILRSTPEAV